MSYRRPDVLKLAPKLRRSRTYVGALEVDASEEVDVSGENGGSGSSAPEFSLPLNFPRGFMAGPIL